jgi:hypothetical protein
MRQKGRGRRLQGLPIGLLTLGIAASAHADVTPIDFQVIHLPRTLAPADHYVAIRTPEAGAARWHESAKNPNAFPIPKIDFKHFVPLIVQTEISPAAATPTSLRPWIPAPTK